MFSNRFFQTNLVLLLSFFQNSILAQPLTFQKTYSNSEWQGGQFVIETADGYLISGQTDGFNANNSEAFLLRIDKKGNVIWQKTYGGPSHDAFYRLVAANDGGFVAWGETKDDDQGNYKGWLVKVDDAGNLEWEKTMNTFGVGNGPNGLILALVDGYVFSGSLSQVNGIGHPYFVRTDNLGNVKWSWVNYFSFSKSLANGVLFVRGDSIYSCGGGNSPANWMRRDLETGLGVEVSSFSGGNSEVLTGLRPTQNGGLVMSGFIRKLTPTGETENLIWVQKQQPDGSILWSKNYNIPGWEKGYSATWLETAADGGNFLTIQNNAEDGGILAKMDENGNIAWAKSYASIKMNGFARPLQTTDGGIIFLGAVADTLYNSDIWILKTDADGNIAGCCSIDRTAEFVVSDYAAPQITSGNLNIYQFVGPETREIAAEFVGNFAAADYCEHPQPTFQDSFLLAPGETVLINGQLFTAPDTLNTTIASATDGCDTLATYFLILKTSSTGSAASDFELKIFPNPAFSNSKLTIENGNFQQADFVLFDLAGRQVLKSQVVENQIFMGENGLPGGIFYFKILEKGKVAGCGKLVLLR